MTSPILRTAIAVLTLSAIAGIASVVLIARRGLSGERQLRGRRSDPHELVDRSIADGDAGEMLRDQIAPMADVPTPEPTTTAATIPTTPTPSSNTTSLIPTQTTDKSTVTAAARASPTDTTITTTTKSSATAAAASTMKPTATGAALSTLMSTSNASLSSSPPPPPRTTMESTTTNPTTTTQTSTTTLSTPTTTTAQRTTLPGIDSGCSNIPTGKRLKCGGDFIGKRQCVNLGCCWNDTGSPKTPCYTKESGLCRRLLGPQRHQCNVNYPVVNPNYRDVCENAGCCFDTSNPYEIFCFQKFDDVCIGLNPVYADDCKRGRHLGDDDCYRAGCCYKNGIGCFAFPNAYSESQSVNGCGDG